MSDVERAIQLAGELEKALTRKGAIGKGLMERARCFEAYLPEEVWLPLRRIAEQRNQIAHGRTKYLDHPDHYARDCELVMGAIRQIPSGAVPRATVSRHALTMPPRRQRSSGSSRPMSTPSASRAPSSFSPLAPPERRRAPRSRRGYNPLRPFSLLHFLGIHIPLPVQLLFVCGVAILFLLRLAMR